MRKSHHEKIGCLPGFITADYLQAINKSDGKDGRVEF